MNEKLAKNLFKNTKTDSDIQGYSCNYINNKLDTVLYSNDDGSNEDITLSETVENFEYVKVIWSVNKQFYSSVEIYNPNNKTFMLNVNTQSIDTRCWTQPNTFNGNVITRGNSAFQNLDYAPYKGELNNSTLIYIHKVIGCAKK